MQTCLSLFLFAATNDSSLELCIAIAAGLFLFVYGFRLLARKRLVLSTPTSKIRSAAMGMVEISGIATGPDTISAPVSGQPCFLARTTAWRQEPGGKWRWEQAADETLHTPFFIDDSTGQMLIDPAGADLDLTCDFREEYASSFFSSAFSVGDGLPSRVGAFLARHNVSAGERIRIEERLIRAQEPLFVVGTLMENEGTATGGKYSAVGPTAAPLRSAFAISAPEVIRLHGGAAPASALNMSQQQKIAAALDRAGITRPEAWAAAGVPYQSAVMELDAEVSSPKRSTQSADFDAAPRTVLKRGASQSTFIISYRSQKQFVGSLAWKSTAMVWGGAAITLVGAYLLMLRMGVL